MTTQVLDRRDRSTQITLIASVTAAPDRVAHVQVMEHALRHLAWLALDDPAISAELPERWRSVLAAYMPEPFQNLA